MNASQGAAQITKSLQLVSRDMKKDFIKATCQISNEVGGKVYSPVAHCNGYGDSRHKAKSSLHFWKELYMVMLDRKL